MTDGVNCHIATTPHSITHVHSFRLSAIRNCESIGKYKSTPVGADGGDNIKMDLQEVGGGCEDWMELAPVRDRWRALVSTVMNLRVPKMRGIS